MKLFKLLLVVALFTSAHLSAQYKKNSIDLSVYPKSDMFITAEDAIKLIDKKGVMFVSGDKPELYVNFHIRGSVVIDAHAIHLSDRGVMKCSPFYQCKKEAEALISHKGISNDTLIIAYDNEKGSNSTAVYSFFKSVGHKKIKMLMGGFKAIVALDPAAQEFAKLKKAFKSAQKPIKLIKKVEKYTNKLAKAKSENDKKAIEKNTKKLAKAKKKTSQFKNFKKTIKASQLKMDAIKTKMDAISKKLLVVKSRKLNSAEKKLNDHEKIALLEKDEGIHHTHYKIHHTNTSAIASKADVLKAMKDIQKNKKSSKYMIIDARSRDEISGKTKADGVIRGGHIPAATFLEWTEVVDEDRGVTLKLPSELKKILKEKGITKDKTIYTYCQVGAGRGSHIATTLEAMGYTDVKVYTGSWDEWNQDKNLPLQITLLPSKSDDDDEEEDEEE